MRSWSVDLQDINLHTCHASDHLYTVISFRQLRRQLRQEGAVTLGARALFAKAVMNAISKGFSAIGGAIKGAALSVTKNVVALGAGVGAGVTAAKVASTVVAKAAESLAPKTGFLFSKATPVKSIGATVLTAKVGALKGASTLVKKVAGLSATKAGFVKGAAALRGLALGGAAFLGSQNKQMTQTPYGSYEENSGLIEPVYNQQEAAESELVWTKYRSLIHEINDWTTSFSEGYKEAYSLESHPYLDGFYPVPKVDKSSAGRNR